MKTERVNMKKLIPALLLIMITVSSAVCCAKDVKDTVKKENEIKLTKEELTTIGFHKKSEIPAELQIRKIFDDYQKHSNCKNIDGFLNLYDDNYKSSDGYDKNRLTELAQESWKEYPDVRYTIKVLSVNVDIDNATVLTQERLTGLTNSSVEYVKGNGYIDSESTAIYYVKRFSNDWKITSDFVINEKTSMRYGTARYIPMQLDAPAIVAPEEEYTAVLKIDVPKNYLALVSINNEPITYPLEKSTEVFRSVKNNGIRERILKSNDNDKNENAIASIGIAKPDVQDNNINVNIVGIAFLSSRVNVVKHKLDNLAPLTKTSVEAKIQTPEATGK